MAPLDSPRLTRLLGRFVDSVRRFKAGDAPPAAAGLCVEPSIARFGRRRRATGALVDLALHEELAKRGLFGGAADLFSLRGERPQPLFALVADGRAGGAGAGGRLAVARRGARRRRTCGRSWSRRRAAPSRTAPCGSLPFACVRYRWRGARAVFDGLDDALA